VENNIFEFPHKEGIDKKPYQEGDSPTPQLESTLQDMQRLVSSGEMQGFVIVGTTTNGPFGAVAGIISPIQIAGLLEYVKLQLIAG